MSKIASWWNGKQARVNPGDPDTIGGAGVFHEMRTEYHWTARYARLLWGFYLAHWIGIWGFIGAAVLAFFAA